MIPRAASSSIQAANAGGDEAVPLLARALKDPHEHLRQATVDAIGDGGDTSARPALIVA